MEWMLMATSTAWEEETDTVPVGKMVARWLAWMQTGIPLVMPRTVGTSRLICCPREEWMPCSTLRSRLVGPIRKRLSEKSNLIFPEKSNLILLL